MGFFSKLGQWMGDPRVTGFQLHFFTASTAVLSAGVLWPTGRIASAVFFAAFFGVKELWFDPTFKNPNEPWYIGVRDFTFYSLGAAAGYAVFKL